MDRLGGTTAATAITMAATAMVRTAVVDTVTVATVTAVTAITTVDTGMVDMGTADMATAATPTMAADGITGIAGRIMAAATVMVTEAGGAATTDATMATGVPSPIAAINAGAGRTVSRKTSAHSKTGQPKKASRLTGR